MAETAPDHEATVESVPSTATQARISPNADRRLNLIAAGLMLVLAFAFMLPGLPPARVAAPVEWLLNYLPWSSAYPGQGAPFTGGDLILQQLPWRHWMQHELAAGRFPLWASAPLGGSPLFASYQSGVLYPLHLLWVLMPVGAGLAVIMALKLWLAGLGMWAFLRAMRLHPAAAGITALSFMFSAWPVNLLPWQITGIYLLVPWMAWAAYTWCREQRRASLPVLSLLVAFAAFAGHPEILFIAGTGLGVYVLAAVALSPRRAWLRQLGGLAAAALAGFALSAVQMLPFLEALGLSHASAQRTSRPFLAGVHLGPEAMLYWILPRYWGYLPDLVGNSSGVPGAAEGSAYVGLVALLGLALALVAALRRQLSLRTALPWLVLGVLSWVLVYDDTLGRTIRSLPIFSQNINTRWLSMLAFSALVLSAFGWDWLARRAALQPRPRWALTAVSLLAVGLAVMAAHAAGLFPPPVTPDIFGLYWLVNDGYRLHWALWALGVLLAALGAAGLWAFAGGRVRFSAPLLLGLVLLADLWRLGVPVTITAPASAYFPPTRFLSDLQAVPPTERLLFEGEVFPANSALVYGIPDWRAQDALISERAFKAAQILAPGLRQNVWTEYNFFMPEIRLEVAPALGIRYIVAADPDWNKRPRPGVPPITRLAYKEGLGLWRIEGVPGFAYLSDRVHVAAGEKEAAEWMDALTWEHVRAYEAVVEAPASAVSGIQPGLAAASPGAASVEHYSPGRIRLRVEAQRQALLVVAESFYPGWRAALDGRPVEILRANYLSQGIVVPEGTHTVELTYEPDSFRNGLLLSLAGLVATVGMGLWAAWPRLQARRAKKGGAPEGTPH